ncbi:MAG: response regulator [Myxococcaceae bacterium]
MIAVVVDDSRAMRTIEQRALESMGWTVRQAANGLEAIGLLSSLEACDLALVDWQMPGMDGLALIKALRADVRWASLPIIMVSSNAVLDSMQTALDAGANDFVMKPFSIDALKERVTETLQTLGSRHA